ncbi:AsmA-like C-terminal region-containing protein [Congregibacter brevis]|uniref:AsmA-like C-terminal region-containing protein n=1 Tax=Congregibacter brevis TaxID=3081201 RepID=A0ABZ0IBI4_9GAMM|nr:AsmA-like C-terminal region-containing protein [Congregibacter sp. IMCC45268]
MALKPLRILLTLTLTLVFTLVTTLVTTTAVFWASPHIAIRALQTATASFTPYKLTLGNPTLKWSPFELQTELLLLTYDDPSRPPVVSLQAVDFAMPLQELFLGNISGGYFEAKNVTYYLDNEDSSEPIDIETLLAPLSRLPNRIDLESVHLISRNENLWIFPLYDVHADRNEAGSMDVKAGLDVAERKVELTAVANWISREGHHRLEVDSVFRGLEEDSRLQATGYVDVIDTELSYELAVNGRYERVSDFLSALDGDAYPFSGNLTVEGVLEGGLDSYTLTLDEIGLREGDVYTFSAEGQIIQNGSEHASLDINAQGSAQEIDELLPHSGALSELLQRSEIEIAVQGTLDEPLIERAALVLYGAGDTRLSLVTQSKALRLNELDSILNTETASATIEGTIGNLGELLLVAGAVSKDVIDAARLGETSASFHGEAHGNMQELRIDLEDLKGAHPIYKLESTAKILWHQDVLSAPELEVRVSQREQTGEVRARGAVADVLQARGVALELELNNASPAPLFNVLNVAPPFEIGGVDGNALLLRSGDAFRLREVEARVQALRGILFEVSGEATIFEKEITADWQLNLIDTTEDAWAALSLPMGAPKKFETTVRLRPTYLTALSDVLIGDTQIQSVVTGDIDRRTLDRLSVDLYTPNLHLDDFASQSTEADPAAVKSSLSLEGLNDVLPVFPTSTTLRSGKVTGPLTQLEDLSVAIDTSAGRLTLREFDARYSGGELILRGNIDSTIDPLAVSLAGRGIRVPLGAVTEDLGLQQNVSGAFSFQGGLVTRGAAQEDWEDNLQGRLSTALSDVTVSGAAYDLLMSNLLAWLVKGAGEKTTTFDCTMAQFDIADGVARSDSIYIETPRMLATGKASIDLPKSKLDVRIEPRSKSRAIQFPSAIRIDGDLSDPKVSASALQAGADLSAQALLLLPSLTLKIFGLDGPGDQNRPCETKAS